jgi:hypothetical protein
MVSTKYILSDIIGFNDIIRCGFNNSVRGDNTNNLQILKSTQIESRTSNKASYKVIRYDKNFLSFDLVSSYGLCRSVIINSNNKVVGFAPPKSIKCDEFIKKYNENTDGIVAEQFVEGTMINVFWDNSIGGWEIATRNTVGATSSFYKGKQSKTFRDMFFDASKETNLVIEDLEKEYCYSFVIQHPENRIVVPFNKPDLYLVAIYKIHNDNNNIFVNVYDIQNCKKMFSNTSVKLPEVYNFSKYSELIEKFGSMNTSYDVVGVVVHNKITGERTKIRNPVYEQVRNLRGNQPKLQYQYLCLRNERRAKEFLKFYPEYKNEFSNFRDQVHLFTNTLFFNYITCYIKKERHLKDFSEQYRTHMFNIHKIFLNELKEKKLYVTNRVVQKFVNELHPSLLMYCLNLQMRKRNIDTIVANSNM